MRACVRAYRRAGVCTCLTVVEAEVQKGFGLLIDSPICLSFPCLLALIDRVSAALLTGVSVSSQSFCLTCPDLSQWP